MNTILPFLMQRVRGVRVLDLAGAACLVIIVLGVYLSKAGAGAEAAKIADTNRQIAAEQQQVDLLRARKANLTQPERLRRLSAQYLAMAPVKPAHETSPDQLLQLRPTGPAPVAVVAQPAPTPVQAAAPITEATR